MVNSIQKRQSFFNSKNLRRCHTLGSWTQAKQCLWTCLQVCGLKELRWHAGHQEVSGCHTSSESEESIACRLEMMQVRDPPWLWNHQRSKTGLSMEHQIKVVQEIFVKNCMWWLNQVLRWSQMVQCSKVLGFSGAFPSNCATKRQGQGHYKSKSKWFNFYCVKRQGMSKCVAFMPANMHLISHSYTGS